MIFSPFVFHNFSQVTYFSILNIFKMTYTITLRFTDQPRFSYTLSRRSHILGLAPKRARAIVLYVMGSRQWLLGDTYIPKRAQELSS